MNYKEKLRLSGVCAVLFLLLTILLKTVDVADANVAGTRIGLSHLNLAVFHGIGVHMLVYRITQVIGVLSLGCAGLWALVGLLQLISRRSLARVDREILALGALYAAVLVLYVLFNKVTVNYRPILMPGSTEPEPSYPSSHTMLVVAVMGSCRILADTYIRDRGIRGIVKTAAAVCIAVMPLGRLIAGVHWLTDVLGGILLGCALLMAFSAAIDRIRKRKKKNRRSGYSSRSRFD